MPVRTYVQKIKKIYIFGKAEFVSCLILSSLVNVTTTVRFDICLCLSVYPLNLHKVLRWVVDKKIKLGHFKWETAYYYQPSIGSMFVVPRKYSSIF